MQLQHCKGHLVWGAKRWLPGSYRVDQGWSQDVKPGSIALTGSSQRRGKNWRLVADNVDRACCEESIRSCFCDSPRLRLFSRSPWRSRRLVCCLVSSEYRLSQSSSQQCKTMQSNICVARLNVNGYGRRRPFDHSQQAIGGVAADSLPSSHVSTAWRLKLGDRRLRRQTQILCDWWLTAHGQHLRYRPFWLHTERFATRTWATLSHLGCCQLSVFWHVLTGEKKRKRMPRSHGWCVSNTSTGNWFAFAVQQQVRALGSPNSHCSFPFSLFSYVSQDPNRLGCEEPPESIEALRCIR